jgi:DNA-binding NarL/FixJ family response regulator
MTIRVLLAEDHSIFRQLLRRVLKGNGIEVVAEADNGADALRLAKELRPDIVLMDVGMPGMDGISATRELIEDMPAVKVLALSGHAERHFVDQMLIAGACGYVEKIAPLQEVVAAIRALHEGRTYPSADAATGIADAVRGPGGRDGDVPGHTSTRYLR